MLEPKWLETSVLAFQKAEWASSVCRLPTFICDTLEGIRAMRLERLWVVTALRSEDELVDCCIIP